MIERREERSVAVGKIRDHEVIFAWEVSIERRLRDLGDRHDLLRAGRPYTLFIKEVVGSFHDPCPGIGLLLCVHENYLDTGQTCLSTLLIAKTYLSVLVLRFTKENLSMIQQTSLFYCIAAHSTLLKAFLLQSPSIPPLSCLAHAEKCK